MKRLCELMFWFNCGAALGTVTFFLMLGIAPVPALWFALAALLFRMYVVYGRG